MSTELRNLKDKIKRLMIKDLSFDAAHDQTDFRIALTDHDYRLLKKETEKIQISKYELDKLIDQVRSEIKFEPKVNEVKKVIPNELKMGQHIRLITRDEKGEALEEMIYIGEFNFVLTKHERGSLELLDELKSETSPWNLGGFIDFQVYRNGERIVKNENLSIYRTKRLTSIQLLDPQFDFEAFYKDKLEEDREKDNQKDRAEENK